MKTRGKQCMTKINFGCGTDLLENYLNIDAVDVPRENTTVQFCKNSLLNPQELPNDYFTEIKAQMVFEHIHPDLIPSTIYTMSCLLKMNGVVHVTVPNYSYFAKQFMSIHEDFSAFTLEDLTKMRESMFQLLDPMIQINESTQYRGHQSFWSPAMAKYWFYGEGFSIDSMKTGEPILSFTAVKKDKYSVAKNV